VRTFPASLSAEMKCRYDHIWKILKGVGRLSVLLQTRMSAELFAQGDWENLHKIYDQNWATPQANITPTKVSISGQPVFTKRRASGFSNTWTWNLWAVVAPRSSIAVIMMSWGPPRLFRGRHLKSPVFYLNEAYFGRRTDLKVVLSPFKSSATAR